MCAKISLFTKYFLTFAPQLSESFLAHDALIVQRIERGFPKPKIWVRFPVGVPHNHSTMRCKLYGLQRIAFFS